MKSIRVFLTVSIISIITLIVFLSVLRGYQSSMQEAQNLFDSKLLDTIQLLEAVSSSDILSGSNSITSEYTAFQIWKNKDEIVFRTESAPANPINKFEEGYSESNFNHYRWRTLARFDVQNNRWFFLAERTDIHYILAENIILESIIPTILALPLLALIIWFVTGYGLNSLDRLARELGNKQADDLSSIPIDNSPQELLQVVNSTNTLLSRLESSFNREKQFSSDAAHEIRTPVSVLKVNLYNLSKQFPNDPNIALLQDGLNRLEHLLEQLLSLHRSSPDQFSANFEKLNLLELTQSVVAEEFVNIDHKSQEVSLEGNNTILVGDKFSLETMIHNLLTNANKYTPADGKIKVSLSENDTGIFLCVEDSGPGIDNKLFSRVFDRFYRIDSDRHNSGQTGCGLGLSIVKHITELHHATIKLSRSESLGGLKVTIFFPRNEISRFQPDNSKNHSSFTQQTANFGEIIPEEINKDISNKDVSYEL